MDAAVGAGRQRARRLSLKIGAHMNVSLAGTLERHAGGARRIRARRPGLLLITGARALALAALTASARRHAASGR